MVGELPDDLHHGITLRSVSRKIPYNFLKLARLSMRATKCTLSSTYKAHWQEATQSIHNIATSMRPSTTLLDKFHLVSGKGLQ
jgi:hypothetical protein